MISWSVVYRWFIGQKRASPSGQAEANTASCVRDGGNCRGQKPRRLCPRPHWLTPETPAAVPEAPAAVPEAPAAVPEAPAAVPEAPAAVPEAPAAVPEAPAAVPEAPAVLLEATGAEAGAAEGERAVEMDRNQSDKIVADLQMYFHPFLCLSICRSTQVFIHFSCLDIRAPLN